jgi:hypothetical protein
MTTEDRTTQHNITHNTIPLSHHTTTHHTIPIPHEIFDPTKPDELEAGKRHELLYGNVYWRVPPSTAPAMKAIVLLPCDGVLRACGLVQVRVNRVDR